MIVFQFIALPVVLLFLVRSLYRLIDKYEIRLTRETEQAH